MEKPIVISRVYDVPVTKVWDALTVNEQMKHWYFQLASFEPVVGFEFEFEGGAEEGTKYIHLCEITEVVPGHKLSHTWRYKGYPGNSLVTWELNQQVDKTLVTLTHSGLETIAVNGPDFQVDNFRQGWTSILNESLAKYLEEKK